VATASRIVRPNTIYRVNVIVLPASPDLIIKSVITQSGGHQIASASQIADAGSSHDLLLKVMSSSFISISKGDLIIYLFLIVRVYVDSVVRYQRQLSPQSGRL
jgi:hypothetical protein